MLTISYEIASKNELYMFLSEANYFLVHEDRISDNNKYMSMSAIFGGKSLVLVIIEAVSIGKLKSARPVYLTAFQFMFLAATLKCIGLLPMALNQLLQNHSTLFNGAMLKTYNNDDFRKGMNLLYGCLAFCLLMAYGAYRYLMRIFVGSFEKASPEQNFEANRFNSLVGKYIMSRFSYLRLIVLIAYSHNYINYTLIFFDFFVSILYFIPVQAGKPVRIPLLIIYVCFTIGSLWMLDPMRIWDAIERSVRSIAFHGTHPLFKYVLETTVIYVIQAISYLSF